MLNLLEIKKNCLRCPAIIIKKHKFLVKSHNNFINRTFKVQKNPVKLKGRFNL